MPDTSVLSKEPTAESLELTKHKRNSLKACFAVKRLHEQNAESLKRHVDADEKLSSALEIAAKNQFDPRRLDHETMASLEAIVRLKGRPVLTVENDSVNPKELDAEWQARIKNHTEQIRKNIQSVCRIEVVGHPSDPMNKEFYLGTGFVVGPRMILTNRHIASEIAEFNGSIKQGMTVRLDFVEEENRDPEQHFIVKRALEIGTDYDYAIFEVETYGKSFPTPLRLAHSPTDIAPVELKPYVYIVGYPAFDSRNPSDVQNAIFHQTYQVKRFAPGRWTETRETASYNYVQTTTLLMDYSSLGGNSGSPVFDLETGLVIGLHYSGSYLESNYAVPIWEIADRIRNNKMKLENSFNSFSSIGANYSMITQPRQSYNSPAAIRFNPQIAGYFPYETTSSSDVLIPALLRERFLYLPLSQAQTIAINGFNTRSLNETMDAVVASCVLNHFGQHDLKNRLISQIYRISPSLGSVVQHISQMPTEVTSGGCVPGRSIGNLPSMGFPTTEDAALKCVAGTVGGAIAGGAAAGPWGAVGGALSGAVAGGCFD